MSAICHICWDVLIDTSIFQLSEMFLVFSANGSDEKVTEKQRRH